MSIDLSLDRIRLLTSYLPAYTRPTCHIAGTNGKGSVSCYISSILSSSSLSVGRFNSPHLVSVHDSITINNKPIGQETYAAARKYVEKANEEHGTGASSFELLATTALYIFELEKLDIVVVEVGMGGRLDATNVIPDEAILISLLTSVDLDHQAFLGSTVTAIAKEKAGIARKNKPFVMGVQKHSEVEQMVRNVVTRVGGDYVMARSAWRRPWDESIDGPEMHTYSLSAEPFQKPPPLPIAYSCPAFPEDIHSLLSLHGRHQLDNLGLALSAISELLTHSSCIAMLPLEVRNNITPRAVSRGIASTSWPGRLSFHSLYPGGISASFQQITRPLFVLVDGAHNPASSETLAQYVSDLLSLVSSSRTSHSTSQDVPVCLTYILALSDSPPKTPKETLAPLFSISFPGATSVQVNAAVLRFTPPEGMPWVKSVSPTILQDVVQTLAPGANIRCAEDNEDDREEESLHSALAWAAAQREPVDAEELVVVAGSLYLVADFYRLLDEKVFI